MNLEKYLKENNGKIISKNKNCLKIKFPTGIMEFKRFKNEKWTVTVPDGINIREVDINFIQAVFKKLYEIGE